MGYRNYSPLVSHVVDKSGLGDFTSVQAAINAAVTAGLSTCDIYINVGTYIENVILVPNYNLIGSTSSNTIIKGKVSLTATGSSTLHDLTVQTNGDYAIEVSGANQCGLGLINCIIDCIDHTGFNFSNSNAGSVLNTESSTFAITVAGFAAWDMTSPGSITMSNSGFFTTANPGVSNNSAGVVVLFNCLCGNNFSTSGTGGFNMSDCSIINFPFNLNGLIANGSGITGFINCLLSNGTASSIVIGAAANCSVISTVMNSSNANVVDGTGTLTTALKTIYFTGASSTIAGTLTTVLYPTGP